MRDPDLVLQARQAAAALERAWQRWRAVHGLAVDPVPPVSSYVGYSLEEPWGQPRVVFGLAAEEAERLAGLLDGHDCVGPVYAAVAALPGGREVPVRSASPAAPARIPHQAPPGAPEQRVPGRRRSQRRSDPLDSAAIEFMDLPDWRPERGARGPQVPGSGLPVANAVDGESSGQDAPVFGHAASLPGAAARESAHAAVREAAAREAAAREAEVRGAAAREAEVRGAGMREAEVRGAGM
ncbi:MAG TPA: hypothetical protein VN840_18980, partial [Streptosporangiaceae bacterium]|nr:hypothetical protein [Streptosporangiaceae bacterium]